MWILMLIMKLNVAMVLGQLLLTINQVTARVGQPSPGHWLEGGQAALARLQAGACCAAHDGRSCPSVL